MGKRVSILIPTHEGRREFVKEILDALALQSLQDFNVIICDNDYTQTEPPLFIKDFKFEINYIINNENIGPQKNIMKLISLADGKYFKFILSDDLISSDFLEKTVNVMEKEVSISAVFTRRVFIDEKGNHTGDTNFHEFRQSENKVLTVNELFNTSCEKLDWFAGELTNFTFRNKTLNYDGLFTPNNKCISGCFKCSYDLVLFINLLQASEKVYYLNEPLCMIRNHDGRTLLQYDSRLLCRLDYFYFLKECYLKQYISSELLIAKTFQLINESYILVEHYKKLSLDTLNYVKTFIRNAITTVKNLNENADIQALHSLEYISNIHINKNILNKLGRHSIIIYGAGEYTKQFFTLNQEFVEKIDCIMDDFRINETMFGQTVAPLTCIPEKLYFVSVYNNSDNMIKNLVACGIDKDKIYIL